MNFVKKERNRKLFRLQYVFSDAHRLFVWILEIIVSVYVARAPNIYTDETCIRLVGINPRLLMRNYLI